MDIVELKSKIAPLAEKYNLKLIVLFGSRVSGRIHQESDYDVAYLSDKEFSSEEESRFILELMPILRVADERLMNLVDMKTASPLLLYSITHKGQLLFEKEPWTFFKLKLRAWKMFLDTQLFRDNCFKIVKKRVLTM